MIFDWKNWCPTLTRVKGDVSHIDLYERDFPIRNLEFWMYSFFFAFIKT